ncbi:unnamed protein product [Thlaspi arvense]|uniref:NYN domain-containing protein n=1 Tax=Thlaspi arvense TaxID=13288 RepID=A0AAU9SUM2_THLAR|nr:unnamed protein product [Thlaspi arvense]
MGESKIEYRFISEDETVVFWNMEDYPFPDSADLCSIRLKIEDALDRMGFHGRKRFKAYGDPLYRGQLDKAEFVFCRKLGEGLGMPLDFLCFAKSFAPKPIVFFVIAKLSPESELHRVLHCLKSRNHTVLVVDNTTAKESLFDTVESVVGCTQVLGGGKPVSHMPVPQEDEDEYYEDQFSELSEEDASSQFDMSKMENFSEIKSTVSTSVFSWNLKGITTPCTVIFWNMEDYPVTCGGNLIDTRRSIEASLNQKGFHGDTMMWAYGDPDPQYEGPLKDAKITLLRSRGDNSEPPLHFLRCAAATAPVPTTFYLIAKLSPEVHNILQWLHSRKHNVLVVNHDAMERLKVGKPSSPHSPLEGNQSISDPDPSDNVISEMEDLSEPITPVKGVKTVVFWDVVACPFPICSGPDEIYGRVVSALDERGCGGEMAIWAYVDENDGSSWSGEYLRDKTWESRIYFIPGGDKASRLQRMLHDTVLWELDSPREYSDRGDVVVVSDQVGDDTMFFRMLEYMTVRCFNVFLVTPTQHVNKPQSADWPGLLLDHARSLGSRSESPEPSPCSGSESPEPNPCSRRVSPEPCSGSESPEPNPCSGSESPEPILEG